ncbi:MAG: IS701 family transposase [Thermomicrobia bacterium]|nr:IS701 family transposase [Thermomicrobia bacterium]
MFVTAFIADLDALHAAIAPRFRRPEVRARARRYLDGLLARVERKNGWQLAEALGERTPDGVQRLLNAARWDADTVRDDLREYVVAQLGDTDAVLVVDETGFLKKGMKSAGVARQYSGTAGRIENCQIGVFLSYASCHGQAFIDRALYLPKVWVADTARRHEAGIPDDIDFATKGELARAMLARAFAAGVPARWVTADEVYGNDRVLRRWLEQHERAYVLGVNRAHRLWSSERGRAERVEAAMTALPADVWQRLSVGDGSKGPRVYDWAEIRFPVASPEGWRHGMLARRSLSDPTEFAYYRVFAPEGATVAELAEVAGRRWTIEMGFRMQDSTGRGGDDDIRRGRDAATMRAGYVATHQPRDVRL